MLVSSLRFSLNTDALRAQAVRRHHPATFLSRCSESCIPPSVFPTPSRGDPMKQRILHSLASCAVLALLIGLLPTPASAQDAPAYVMWETIYLTVKPGHANALAEELAEHNRLFHAEGPHTAYVSYIVNGPHTGDMLWRMGPTTFSDLDGRPSGDPHDSDWDNDVLVNCEKVHTAEYWRLNENLSRMPEPDAEPPALVRVRFFDVADNALFRKTQGQLLKVAEERGVTRPRLMFRNQDVNRDGRDWIAVSFYENWAERDEDGPELGFREAFNNVHGEDTWDTFWEEVDKAIVSRYDEWRQAIPELGGASTADNDE